MDFSGRTLFSFRGIFVLFGILSIVPFTRKWVLFADGLSEIPSFSLTGLEIVEKLIQSDAKEKFLFYAPHDGFGNQMIEFRNILRVAGILNRTLIVPPLLSHYDVIGGDCVTGGAKTQQHYRQMAWRVMSRRLSSSAYVSVADVISVAKLQPGLVRMIDLRLFVAIFCGIDISQTLSFCSWCQPLLQILKTRRTKIFSGQSQEILMDQCGRLLGGGEEERRLRQGELEEWGFSESVKTRLGTFDVFRVERGCEQSLFTFGRDNTGSLSTPFRRERRVRYSCPQGDPPRVNHGALLDWMEIYESEMKPLPEAVNVETYLSTPSSRAWGAKVINFGSTFNYFSLDPPTGDERVNEISCATEFLGFTSPLSLVGKKFAKSKLKNFACLHFRGGDGYYKQERETNRGYAANQLRRLHTNLTAEIDPPVSVPLFVMTDLKTEEWENKFSQKFGKIGFKIRMTSELGSVEEEARIGVLQSAFGLFTNKVQPEIAEKFVAESRAAKISEQEEIRNKAREETQDMTLHLEQIVCSCANLGFVGDKYSTLTKAVIHLRSGNWCTKEQSFS